MKRRYYQSAASLFVGALFASGCSSTSSTAMGCAGTTAITALRLNPARTCTLDQVAVSGLCELPGTSKGDVVA